MTTKFNRCISLWAVAAALLALSVSGAESAELRVPACAAYLEPNPDGARVSARAGITGWRDPALKILWFGEIKTPGTLEGSVALRLPPGATSKLRLTVAQQSHEATVTGKETNSVMARFGLFDLASPGYQRFTLESLNESGQPFGDLDALVLDGPATKEAHFNLKPRRNAASVHLFFLSHGGFVPGFTEYREKFTRPATGKAPANLVLPERAEARTGDSSGVR